MKKILILLAFIPSLILAQIPTGKPSFTVLQRVGTGEVEFTFKPISIEEPLEVILEKEKAFYPGGRTFFIIRLNKDMTFSEMNIPKGNYVGGFKMIEDQFFLSLEQEEMPEDLNEDKLQNQGFFNIPLEILEEFECQIKGQSFMVLPSQGGLNFSSVTFVLGNQTLFLTIGINDADFFSKIEKELNKAKSTETKKFLRAAQYAVESKSESEVTLQWLENVIEQDERNWEGYYWKAQFFANMNDFGGAIKSIEKARILLQKDKYLNTYQKNETSNEIDNYIRNWSSKL